jgi:hypothetical protein
MNEESINQYREQMKTEVESELKFSGVAAGDMFDAICAIDAIFNDMLEVTQLIKIETIETLWAANGPLGRRVE